MASVSARFSTGATWAWPEVWDPARAFLVLVQERDGAPCWEPSASQARTRCYRRGMSSENLHEAPELLSDDTKNLHRALVSLREELEAVDWYQQRAEACTDSELAAVLIHNKNEEIEHAMMTLEWLRRHDPKFAENISTYVGSSGPIVSVEQGATGGSSAEAPSSSVSLGIGSLKGVE